MYGRLALIGFTYSLSVTGSNGASGECVDLHGRTIAPGLHFVPGPDTCTLCVCDNGSPKWCKAVLCSPPQDCKSFRVGNSCCEFICLDDTLGKDGSGHDINADLGLRLIASAITAILSLSLLFFLIHRLRQRKIRGRQTQLSEDERSLGSIGYIAGSLGYLPGSLGCQDFHYEEPPSHYPLWKPPGNYFPRGEAPPPYEEAVAAARAEAALAARTTAGPSLSLHSHLHHQHRTIPLNLATSGPLNPAPSAGTEHNIVTSSVSTVATSASAMTTTATATSIIRPEAYYEDVIPPPQVMQQPTSSISSITSPAVIEAAVVETESVPEPQLLSSLPMPLPTVLEDDDYRSECENCNLSAQQGDDYYLDQDLETMTLHRRPHDIDIQEPYPYRTSLTLPTHCRRQRSTPLHGTPAQSGARENWFSSMPASSSSSSDDEE